MALKYFLSVLLTHNLLMSCASAAVHSHSIDTQERESDGSYRARDSDHYGVGDNDHNTDFDHEAIIGSVREAEEFDRMTPDQAKAKLMKIVYLMDLNNDQHIDRLELKKWILNSFGKLSREEAEERMQETDDNRDGEVSWQEYLRDAFGVDAEDEIGPDDTGDSGMLVQEEKAMWAAADVDGDGRLQAAEFLVFSNPEEHEAMHPFLLNQTLREKDLNQDGLVDFQEFLGDRALENWNQAGPSTETPLFPPSHGISVPRLVDSEAPQNPQETGKEKDKSWVIAEKDKFDHEWDQNGDGVLDHVELKAWLVPDNNEIAEEEVSHLFDQADEDRDELLSVDEVMLHYDVFVGSEADYEADPLGEHFDDEL